MHPLDKPLSPWDSEAAASVAAEKESGGETEGENEAGKKVRSYVILLPDENGRSSGAIEVRSGDEVVILDAPNEGTSLQEPARTFTADAAQMEQFSAALAVEPPAPLRFEIFFDSDAAKPTAAAVAAVQAEIDRMKSWPVPEIVLVGHADRAGGSEYNLQLSRRRAEAVRLLLAGQEIEGVTLKIEALGETAPAVTTGDGVAEARNRRVEILIR